MQTSPIVLAALLSLSATAGAQQRVALADLPALARARAERQRPLLLEQLAPFLADLQTEYGRNAAALDETIAKVRALGDAVVPILVEYLTPESPTPQDEPSNRARWLAANACRTLRGLDPAAHVDTWIDLASGEHPIGRRHAIELLGASGDDPRVPAALQRIAPALSSAQDRIAVLRAATAQGTPELQELATAWLATAEPELRGAALDYLKAQPTADAVPAAITALRSEPETGLLRDYIALFAAVAPGDRAVAEALVPLIGGSRLDPEDRYALFEALATIAPQDHGPTIDALVSVLEKGESGPLGVRAARTALALGDKHAVKILFERLDSRARESRGNATPFADRAEAYFAFGKHREAIRDWEQAIKNSAAGSRQAAFQLQIARCEAHRGSVLRMLRALQDSGVSAHTIRAEAAKDPVFEEMLQRDQAQRFLETLSR